MSQLPPEIPAENPPFEQPSAPKPGKGLAIAALILGLVGLIPVIGALPALVGIILGIVALAAKKPGKGMAITGIVAGVLGVLLGIGGLVYGLNIAVSKANQAACAGNLNSVYKGIVLYQQNYDQAYPADFETLIKDIPLHWAFQCQAAQRSGSSKQFDYFYLAPTGINPDFNTIVACDYKDNHPDQTRNVLYAGGNVARRTEAAFQAELSQPYNAAFAAALRKAEGP